MSIKSRLEKLEKGHKSPPRVFIIRDGAAVGKCNGEDMTLTEWEAIARPEDVRLTIVRPSEIQSPGE